MTRAQQIGITEMSLTQLLALSYSDIILRIRSGEWDLDQFSKWAEDRLNCAYGDGYDEGYTAAEDYAEVNRNSALFCQ